MITRNLCSASATKNFETLSVSKPSPFVAHVEFNRPDKYNALNHQMWLDIGDCFNHLNADQDCRAIVVSAKGKHFTAGLDLTGMMKLGQELAEIEDVSRKGRVLEGSIKAYQDSFSSIENCVKPVITAVHSACVGAGMDFITAADIRYCTTDAWFQVTEVNIGMAADVGTLQRLPKAIGSQSLVRELCYTARKMKSDEAKDCGLVSRTFESKDEMVKAALALAELIAEKSPLAVQTTKASIVYSMDHTNEEGLLHIVRMGNKN
jgi:Delta3,5-Delta2,4-dienoyl-CoA isomerase